MPQPFYTKPLGSPFIELQSVDSTNNYARAQIPANHLTERQTSGPHGLTVFAHEQVAGKGQRGKVWLTEKGANIALSILINPAPLQLFQQFQLSACVAVALHDFFAKYAGSETKIKWPNDLYWQDRKAGGILIENTINHTVSEGSGNWAWSVIGIGININQTSFPSDLPNPVSLRQITGQTFQPLLLAKELCNQVNKYYHQLQREGFDEIISYYNSCLYQLNKKVKLKKSNRIFEAEIKCVNRQGSLVVKHAIEETFDFGEIEWIF